MDNQKVDLTSLTTELASLHRQLAEFEAAETRHKKAAESLQQSEEKFKTLFNYIKDAIFIHDLEGRFLEVNHEACERLDYSREELLQMTPLDLDTPEFAALFSERTATVQQYGQYIFESAHRRRDGKVIPVEISSRLFELHGKQLILSVCRDITERKQAELDRHEIEARQAAILRTMPLILYNARTPSSYSATWMTFNVEQVTGFSIDPFIREPGFWASRIHPDDRNHVMQAFKNIPSDKTKEIEYRWQCADGSYHWFLDHIISIQSDKDGEVEYFGIWQDISERKQAEESLVIKENAIASAINGIAISEFDGNLTYVNRAFLRLWGYEEENEVLGLPAVSFWRSAEEAEQVITALKQSDAWVGELVAKKKDGSLFEAQIAASVVRDGAGKPICMMCSFLDITERNQAEENRRKLEVQVQQTQKLESLGVLAGGIAHDFNNILMAILGHTQLALVDLPPDASVRASLQEVENAAHRAAELCRQMLTYAGRGPSVVELINLTLLVQEMTPLLQISISKKVLLRCHFPEHLPVIEADSAQVRQVVMNLILNASEAIGDHEGTIVITAGTTHCDESYIRESHFIEPPLPGKYAFLEVADTGCGMDTETRSKIFDPFFTTKFIGRGLGLAAVLGIIQGHKGAIKLDTEPGKGTTFRVLFPAEQRLQPK